MSILWSVSQKLRNDLDTETYLEQSQEATGWSDELIAICNMLNASGFEVVSATAVVDNDITVKVTNVGASNAQVN